MISEKLPKIYVPGKHSPVRQDSGSLVDIDFDIPSSTIRIRSLGTYIHRIECMTISIMLFQIWYGMKNVRIN